MVVNIVDVGWATSKSGCLPISGPKVHLSITLQSIEKKSTWWHYTAGMGEVCITLSMALTALAFVGEFVHKCEPFHTAGKGEVRISFSIYGRIRPQMSSSSVGGYAHTRERHATSEGRQC